MKKRYFICVQGHNNHMKTPFNKSFETDFFGQIGIKVKNQKEGNMDEHYLKYDVEGLQGIRLDNNDKRIDLKNNP